MDNYSTFVLLLFLLVLSGVFSGSEIALISLSKARVRAMIDQNIPNSRVIDKLKANPNRLLITILIGNNLVNISASVVTTVWATKVFGSESLGYVTGILTLLVLIFGEIFPKTYAQKYAEEFSQIIAKPLLFLEYVFYPVILLLEFLLEYFIKKLNKNGKERNITPVHEVKAMIEIAAENGYIEENVEEIISNVFSFEKKTVNEIMTLRNKITMIKNKASLKKLRKLFIKSSRSRIPVYKKDKNNIIGIVTMKLLLQAQDRVKKSIKKAKLEPAIVIDKETLIDDLLIQFQRLKQQIAIVKDGSEVVGLVTMENVLEELVGEIFDETEKNREFTKKHSDRCWIVRADCPIDEFRKKFEEFESGEAQFKSIESLFYEKVGNDYEIGRNYKFENYTIKAHKSESGRISQFIICKLNNIK